MPICLAGMQCAIVEPCGVAIFRMLMVKPVDSWLWWSGGEQSHYGMSTETWIWGQRSKKLGRKKAVNGRKHKTEHLLFSCICEPKQKWLYGWDFDHATFEIPLFWLSLRRSTAGTAAKDVRVGAKAMERGDRIWKMHPERLERSTFWFLILLWSGQMIPNAGQ